MMKKTLYASLAICAIIAIPLTAGAEKSSERNYGVTDPKPIPAEEKAHPYKMDLSKLPSPKVDHEKDKQIAEKHHGEFYSEHFTAPKPISEETYPTVSESGQDNQQ
ncbi:hypothetical protein CBW65_03915 [Tumebacillus avium]|uniref:Uncharacterized protein n=1 Tax=Tumebacillus avium TaxID=1903704 RepID=A0A1Y0ILQ9_9BACL|nr:hypothetical protein [Tumebacillus avium]ARU60303.1 hypothetical protein CBW65_03915 [Tumebacillus avium]